MIIYMIRHRDTKRFAGEGQDPFPTAKYARSSGKFWTGPGALKAHISQALYVMYGTKPTRIEFRPSSMIEYLNCDVVVTDTETLLSELDPNFIVNYLKQRASEMLKEHPTYVLSADVKTKLGL